jgi:single-stranded-DNA-specific exonuclease
LTQNETIVPPYDELCGCGIGFKLIQALGGNRNQTTEDLIPYLDVVAAIAMISFL